jgi:hypothetical protein
MILAGNRLAHLVTLNPDGSPQVTVRWQAKTRPDYPSLASAVSRFFLIAGIAAVTGRFFNTNRL